MLCAATSCWLPGAIQTQTLASTLHNGDACLPHMSEARGSGVNLHLRPESPKQLFGPIEPARSEKAYNEPAQRASGSVCGTQLGFSSRGCIEQYRLNHTAQQQQNTGSHHITGNVEAITMQRCKADCEN